MKLTLNGAWKVTHIPFGAQMEEILSKDFVPEGWLTAQLPEDIHTTLRRNGILRGHTYHKEPEEERWVEECDWIYHRAFLVPADFDGNCVELVCEGLDTFCSIYLNGVQVGQGENMHRRYVFPVKDVLKPGRRNVLVIRIASPIKAVEGMDTKGIFSITTSDRILARKAQMNYSWDFCGRTVTAGVWKDIGLECRSEARIGNWQLCTRETKGATLQLSVPVDWSACQAADRDSYSVGVQIKSPEGAMVWQQTYPAQQAEHLTLQVENPRLWWPRPYGEQPLYELELTLEKDGQQLDRCRHQFGIRTLEVLRENQPDGESFQFAVNGRRLFIRGANWVPIKTVYTDITDRDYERYLEDAARGNISMLRIWGGGIYESTKMFEECDRLGILIWSDFMLACGIYPQKDAFLENVRQEARDAVLKYRNYTCLAIWSGDNENGQAYGWAGRLYEFEKDRIGNQVIRSVCQELDPERYYIPTSPCSPSPEKRGGDDSSSPHQGDQHIYIMSANPGVQSNRDYGREYYKRITGFRPRFMSEFGFVGLPEKDSFYRFNFRREKLRHPEEMVKFLPSCEKYLTNGDFEEAIYYSQLFHAQALKYWIEYFRSLKGTCNGTLYWKFNDPLADQPVDYIFPSHMCSVDMYGNFKMSYFVTRRAYADFLVEAVEQEEGLAFYAVNETPEEKQGIFTWQRLDFEGRVYGQNSQPCVVAADSAVCLGQVSFEEIWGKAETADRKKQYARQYLRLTFAGEGSDSCNRYFFLDLDENDRMELPNAELCVKKAVRSENKIRLTLKAGKFARTVRLFMPDVRVYYSDNYFDLDAGAEYEIEIELDEKEKSAFEGSEIVLIEAENNKKQGIPLDEMEELV